MATDMKQWLRAGIRNNIITLITQATTMKTMRKFMIGAFCVLATALTAQAQTTEEDRMLTTAIRYLDVPYAAHTLDQDGPEELILYCDEVDCTTLVEYVLAESLCHRQRQCIRRHLCPKTPDDSIPQRANRRIHLASALYHRLD